MAKSKLPPETPASFDRLMELTPLFMDLYDLLRTSNDLDNIDPISAMILATVTADNQPMTAEDMAFFLGTPLRTVKSKLKRLMKTGIIELDGERFRYNPPRELTHDEQRRMDAIKRAFDELRPTLEKLNRLDS
jgi:predicted transcriptional regulator